MPFNKRQVLTSAALAAGAILARRAGLAARADEAPATPPLTLTAQKTRLRLPGASDPVDVVSFDGTAGGPVITLARGAPLDLRLTNELDVPFALQWHGMRTPNASDGDWPLAGARLAPGATQAVRFTPPDSGLTWFRAAALPGLPDLAGQGLRGVLIVAESEPPPVDRDVLLTLADWRQGGAFTVNGKDAPERTALRPGDRLRLRVLNASTMRAMILGIEGGRPLIVAIDGQPSELFEPVRDAVPVGPGARFEFMIDMPRAPGGALRVVLRGSKEGGEADRVLFEARLDGAARTEAAPIEALPRNRALAPAIPLEAATRADLRIEAVPGTPAAPARWRLNGTAGLELPAKPLLTVKRGGSVTLGFDNRGGALVAMRLHGHVMRLLHAKDDGWEPYWRDSVLLPPGGVTHVAFVADNPGRWLLESALFEQAAFGLRHWFEVT